MHTYVSSQLYFILYISGSFIPADVGVVCNSSCSDNKGGAQLVPTSIQHSSTSTHKNDGTLFAQNLLPPYSQYLVLKRAMRRNGFTAVVVVGYAGKVRAAAY
jgi:hypothetical protein